MSIKAVKMTVGLPFNLGTLEFEPDEVQQQAAWMLYVELSTRVTNTAIGPNDGLLRETLDSLYSLFEITRQVLREAGPSVAKGPASFGPIAIEVLNKGLRPFIAKWHRELSIHEQRCPPGINALDHELNWEQAEAMGKELTTLKANLSVYVDALAKIAGIE